MNTLINIASLEEEKLLLSDFIDNTFIFVAELYQKCKNLNNRYYDDHTIQNQHFELLQNAQNYLSLINPEIIVISDQYNQFNSLTSSFENIISNIPSDLKQNKEFFRKEKLIQKYIQEEKKYFKPFECLYNQHMHAFKQLIDFDVLEKKMYIYSLLACIIEESEKHLADVSIIDFANYIEKIQAEKISLKCLQEDNFYKKMKMYIRYFDENKETLKETVLNTYIIDNNCNNTKKKKADKLQSLHKYHASKLNELYSNKCAHIPQIESVQTNLRNLEEFITDFTDYYAN